LGTELLECAQSAPADRNLRDIARINRMMRDLAASHEHISVLDVGAGSGDMGRCLTRHFRNGKGYFARSSPLSPTERTLAVGCSRCDRASISDRFIRLRPVFFLVTSFSRRPCNRYDREATVIRAPRIALAGSRASPCGHFLPMTKRVFGWCPLTVHDGPKSVASAFRVEELASLANAAGATVLAAQRHWPWFPISVVVPSGVRQISRISGASQPQALSSAAD
jgi:hypothetical protein